MIVYSPMGSGLLAGGMTRERIEACRRMTGARPTRASRNPTSPTWRWSSACMAVAERHDTTPGAVAVAWTLRNPAVDGAIVGFRRPSQVDAILVGSEP